MMPPFVVLPTNRIAHFVEVSLYYFIQHNRLIYFVQRRKNVNSSAGSGSDRSVLKSVTNQWINKKIEYSVNDLENGEQECEAMIIVDNDYYYIQGCIPEKEFVEILEYLYFY